MINFNKFKNMVEQYVNMKMADYEDEVYQDDEKRIERENELRINKYQMIEKEIENKITKRRNYMFYLTDLYYIVEDINLLINEQLKYLEKSELAIYQTTMLNYQFGLANQDLKKYSSIDVNLKYMRILFKEANSSTVSKELFENLTKKQKEELKSYKKMRFMDLIKDETITRMLLTQFDSIKENLRVIFYEDIKHNINVDIIYKEKAKGSMFSRKMLRNRTCVLLKFQISQHEVLEIMKENPETKKVYGDALEFNLGKLTSIIQSVMRVSHKTNQLS